MLNSELSIWALFSSVGNFFCLTLRCLQFYFVFCFHRFVSIWQRRVISLFTSFISTVFSCGRASFFFHRVKYQTTKGTNCWCFQICVREKKLTKKNWNLKLSHFSLLLSTGSFPLATICLLKGAAAFLTLRLLFPRSVTTQPSLN